MTKYLVFLDIDGVLTSNRVHFSKITKYPVWAEFDPVAINFFNKIYQKFPVKFVLMTSWKNNLPNISGTTDRIVEHWMLSAFANAGFIGEFAEPIRTNPTDDKALARLDRAHEVAHYLENYAEGIQDYILFDDTNYQFDKVLPKKRFVRTDPQNGLLHKHMLIAASIMGDWHERS